MKSNLNSVDRIVRVLFAVIVAILYFTQMISGTAGIVLLIVGGVLALTSVISFCPLYFIMGLSTKNKTA